MKRLALFGVVAVVFSTAAPAMAQSSETAGSSSGQLIVVFATVAAALSAFLLIIILFGKSRSTSKAAVQSRLGAWAATSRPEGSSASSRSCVVPPDLLRAPLRVAERPA